MHNGPGAVAIAWAENPFSPPSLKWTAMVTPLLDELPAPEARHASGSLVPDRLELGNLDRADQAAGLARLEPARTDLERGRGPGGHCRAECLLIGAAIESRRDEGGEQDVAGADDRDGVDQWRGRAVAARGTLVSEQRPAAGLTRDQGVPRPELGDRLQAGEEVVVVVELLADERLGLALVRRDEQRLGLHAQAQRLTLRVEHGVRAAAIQLAHRLGVEAVVDPARQRAREDDVLGPLREVDELLEQHLQLLGRDVRAPLVHLGVAAAGRIDDRRRGARLVVDPHEVVQDRLGRQLLDDPRAGAPAGESGGDDGHAETLQRAGDVDPLAACEGEPGAGAVALAALEVRDGQRPVDRRVHGDGDDHETQPHMWWRVRVAYQPTRPATPGLATAREATSGTAPTSLPRW